MPLANNVTDLISDVNGILLKLVEIDKNKLVPGQHIFVYRAAGYYSHHGIYVGRDSDKSQVQYVIHFVPQNGSSTNSEKCKVCSYRKNADGGVVRTCLNCFMSCSHGGTKLFLYQYGVSFIDKRISCPGSCSRAPAKPLQEIVKTAYNKLNKAKTESYNLASYNCETFATECSTGKGKSAQVNNVAAAAGGLAVAAGFAVAAGALGIVACNKYYNVKAYFNRKDEDEDEKEEENKKKNSTTKY